MSLDLCLQKFACKVDPAFDGSQRFAQHISDLVVFESVEIQKKRIAEDLRQVMNGRLNFFQVNSGNGFVGHRPLVQVQQVLLVSTQIAITSVLKKTKHTLI